MRTISEFVKITRRVIARDGFDGFLPTALYPGRRDLVVLEGVPDGDELEACCVRWAEGGAIANEEFLVAFKIGPTQFRVVHRFGSGSGQAVRDFAIGDA